MNGMQNVCFSCCWFFFWRVWTSDTTYFGQPALWTRKRPEASRSTRVSRPPSNRTSRQCSRQGFQDRLPAIVANVTATTIFRNFEAKNRSDAQGEAIFPISLAPQARFCHFATLQRLHTAILEPLDTNQLGPFCVDDVIMLIMGEQLMNY